MLVCMVQCVHLSMCTCVSACASPQEKKIPLNPTWSKQRGWCVFQDGVSGWHQAGPADRQWHRLLQGSPLRNTRPQSVEETELWSASAPKEMVKERTHGAFQTFSQSCVRFLKCHPVLSGDSRVVFCRWTSGEMYFVNEKLMKMNTITFVHSELKVLEWTGWMPKHCCTVLDGIYICISTHGKVQLSDSRTLKSLKESERE